MSLKATKNFYSFIIDAVIKEIAEDPEMDNISSKALDYLQTVWRNKLESSGVYQPEENNKLVNTHYLAYPHMLFSQDLISTRLNPELRNTEINTNEIIVKEEPNLSNKSDLGQIGDDQDNYTSDKISTSQKDDDLTSKEDEKEESKERLVIKKEYLEDDDAQLFEYQEPAAVSQPDQIPRSAFSQESNHVRTNEISVSELDPYNPQDKPLGPEDDVEEYKQSSDTTNILVCVREKGHRSKSKWKQTFARGILHLNGKEYILSHIECNLEFK